MTNDDGRKPEGAPERSPKAGAGGPSGVDRNGPKRFSVQRKMAIVARLLRGEPLELVARETKKFARLKCAEICGRWRPKIYLGKVRLPTQHFEPVAICDSDDEVDAHSIPLPQVR